MSLAKAWFLLSVAVSVLPAAEFTVQTVDGLKRPIAGVEVEITCAPVKRVMGVFPRNSASLRYTSDQKGLIHGAYDAWKCKPLASVSKEGYEAYSSGFRDRYVLKRLFSAQEIDRIVKLEGDDLLRELRELLAGSGPVEAPIFRYEAHLRPALRMLARDPDVTIQVRYLLSMIAVPEDLHLLLQLPPPPPGPPFFGAWEYPVASKLVNPDNEEEWAFLENCALGEFDTFWPRNGAIQTLQLTGGVRSEKILEQIARPAEWKNVAVKALEYIKSKPAPLTSPDLDALAGRVAQALDFRPWKLAPEPLFNEAGDKALVTFEIGNLFGNSVYTGTFHKIDGLWTFRGGLWVLLS